MSYKYSFADNAQYSAADLNALVGSLVSSGVADAFEDGVAYNASKVNDIVAAVYSEGVVPDSVDTLKVTKQSDGVLAIAPGLAFFADGSTIRVTAAEVLSYETGVKNYVYLKQDLAAQNRSYPACTTEAPTGDFVLLAEISESGEVTDKRTYAKGKVPGYQSNANSCMVVEKTIYIAEGSGREGTATFSIDMGTNNFSRVFFIGRQRSDYGEMGIYDLTDGSYYCLRGGGVSNTWGEIFTDKLRKVGSVSTHTAYITFAKNGNMLNGTLDWYSSSSEKNSFVFTLIFC